MEKPSLGIVLHIYNEQLLLPHFIRHHLSMVDEVFVINHHSSDNSLDIIKNMAPLWKCVPTTLSNFDARGTDEECMFYETQLQTKWKCTLTVTEFLFNHDYVEILERLKKENPEKQAFAGKCFSLIDYWPHRPPVTGPLWRSYSYGSFSNLSLGVDTRWRFAHCAVNGQYTPGRHTTYLPAFYSEELFLLHWRFAPWPQVKERKLQIQHKVPASDLMQGMGAHHIRTDKELEDEYQSWLNISSSFGFNQRFLNAYCQKV